MIGTVLGHFRIEEKLGAGGMGEVYLAHDLTLDRRVALKFIRHDLASDPEARRRFEREARALAALDHPYVGAVYGVEEAGGRLFMVLAYVEGASLESLLRGGPLPPERARLLFARIAGGLGAAHRRGIVHRDVKSANIMIGDGDRPKLVDFGIALRGGETRLTQTGAYAGTPGFTAPEVFRGEPADARADVFSLGVVFHQALTGHLPFERDNPAAAMHAVLNEDPPPFPRDLPAESLALETLVRRCLEKDPARRFADAAAVAHALESGEVAQDGALPPAARAGTKPVLPPRRGGRRRGIAALLGAGLALAIAVAGWLLLARRNVATRATAGAPGRRAVAVLAFDNLTGDPSLDWMKRGVAELLGAALVQSPALDVFDAQRLNDLVAAATPGASPSSPAPSPSIAFLAKHGIGRAITGTILRSGTQLHIEGRIVDTDGGRPVHSYGVEGAADGGLFPLVARLVSDLQVALEVNLTGNREAEGWLREITTTSADAYRLYLRGHEALLASHWKEAATAYEQALAIDSTFIAARTELSGAYWNLGDNANLELTRAAMRRLRGRADYRDQLRIDLLEAVVSGNPPGLIRAASGLVQLYPENRFYTYLLGRGYYTAKEYQRCLDTLKPLMAQRYSWSWTYVLSARSADRLGDPEAARRAFDLGMEVTRGDPELAYAYIRYLETRGERARIRPIIETALRSPALAETPAGEGELRLELAKELLASGDSARGRDELARAARLIPADDEARAETDSLRKVLGVR